MNRQPRRFGQSGFSLLEVLITLLITAVGLMGFAAMMLNSAKTNRIAMQRSVATAYAYDIIDCMRANRQAAVAGDYTVDFDGALSGTTVAAEDVTAWKTALSDNLPGGKGKISFTGNTVKVEVKWTETVNSSQDHTWETETTL